MGADADSHIERSLKRNPQPAAGHMQHVIVARQRHVDVVATLDQAKALGRGNIRLDLVSDVAFLSTELESRHADAMPRDVDVDGIPVKTLAEHQNCLAMLIAARAQKTDVGCENHIAGDSLPGKLEGIRGEPHVLATACDGVALVGKVILNGARVEHSTYVAVTLKYSNGCVVFSPRMIRQSAREDACQQDHPQDEFSSHALASIAVGTRER